MFSFIFYPYRTLQCRGNTLLRLFPVLEIVIESFQMFRQLHNAYVDMLCNPFYIPGESITSK